MTLVEGAPRKRRSQNSNLKQEVRRRNRIFLVIAPLGIVGEAGTGRKTLAHRFANMDEGVFEEEIPVAYYYRPSWEGEFPQYSNHQFSRFRVKLTVYIIEEPLELPRHQHPFYMAEWDRFCCLVFLFDINRTTTFGGLLTALENFRIEGLRVPVLFLVGNKCDERPQSPPRRNRNENEEEAENQGIKHFLCSAKRNIGVEPLLIEIKKLAIAKKYWFP